MIEIKIRVGEVYTIRQRVPIGNCGVVYKPKRLRVVARYKHVILFEDDKGVRECFTPWELERCVV